MASSQPSRLMSILQYKRTQKNTYQRLETRLRLEPLSLSFGAMLVLPYASAVYLIVYKD